MEKVSCYKVELSGAFLQQNSGLQKISSLVRRGKEVEPYFLYLVYFYNVEKFQPMNNKN